MNVSLGQIGENPETFKFQIKEKDLKRRDERFSFEPVVCSISLKKPGVKILLTGTYSTSITGKCDICREATQKSFTGNLDLVLLPESDREDLAGDHELSMEEIDIEYYKETELPLGDLVEDQILLDLPYSFRCSDSCKGICINCNTNLNLSSCDCHIDSGTNPFRILKDIL